MDSVGGVLEIQGIHFKLLWQRQSLQQAYTLLHLSCRPIQIQREAEFVIYNMYISTNGQGIRARCSDKKAA